MLLFDARALTNGGYAVAHCGPISRLYKASIRSKCELLRIARSDLHYPPRAANDNHLLRMGCSPPGLPRQAAGVETLRADALANAVTVAVLMELGRSD